MKGFDPVYVWNPIGFEPRAYLPDELHRHGDCARYILHLIHYGNTFGRAKQGWVRLKAAILRRSFPSDRAYKQTRDRLIERGAIICDHHYVVGEKSFGFQLGPELFGMRQHKVIVADKRLANKIRDNWEEWVKAPKEVHQYLLYHLRNGLEIDYPAALQWLHWSGDPRGMGETAIQLIRDGQIFFHVCDYGRVHSNLTNFRSDLRGFLSYRGQELVNLDIRNSQPLFFSILLRQRYGGRGMPSDVQQYVELCQAGQFYDHLMTEWGINAQDRGEFKQKFFGRVFFCENWPEVETAKRFGEQFPSVYALIREMKTEDYTALSKALQRAESDLMIGKVAVRCMNELPRAFVGTIHDSIVTTRDHAHSIRSIMLEEFGRIGLSPTINIEDLVRPSLNEYGFAS